MGKSKMRTVKNTPIVSSIFALEKNLYKNTRHVQTLSALQIIALTTTGLCFSASSVFLGWGFSLAMWASWYSERESSRYLKNQANLIYLQNLIRNSDSIYLVMLSILKSKKKFDEENDAVEKYSTKTYVFFTVVTTALSVTGLAFPVNKIMTLCTTLLNGVWNTSDGGSAGKIAYLANKAMNSMSSVSDDKTLFSYRKNNDLQKDIYNTLIYRANNAKDISDAYMKSFIATTVIAVVATVTSVMTCGAVPALIAVGAGICMLAISAESRYRASMSSQKNNYDHFTIRRMQEIRDRYCPQDECKGIIEEIIDKIKKLSQGAASKLESMIDDKQESENDELNPENNRLLEHSQSTCSGNKLMLAVNTNGNINYEEIIKRMEKAIEKLKEYHGEATQPSYNETLKAILNVASLKLSNEAAVDDSLNSIASQLFNEGSIDYQRIFYDAYIKLDDDNAPLEPRLSSSLY